ncbi:MAG: amidohydrolase family protein, partial [Acidimicrobiia bacterium]|nr:amidohydrolase family protein [Acidimicrobiia bacterium]
MRTRLSLLVALIALLATACSPTATEPTTTLQPETTTTTAPVVTETTSTSSTTTTTAPPINPADTVFVGGTVVTMDETLGTVEALAVSEGVIAAAGSAADIEPYVGSETEVIELEGRVVAPGFVDAHTHVLSDAGDLAAGQREALRVGITTLADASVEPGVYEAFVTAAEEGQLTIRTGMYLTRNDVCGSDMGDWYLEHPAGETYGDRLWVAGVKVFSDGSFVCGAVAVSETFLEGYEPEPPFHDVDTLSRWYQQANDAGYQIITHAQGDVAIEGVMDAYESVIGASGNPLRHRIEHNSIPRQEILPRYGELNLGATVFALTPACSPDAPWTDFMKTNGDRPHMIAAANPGLIVAWHGDDPYVPPLAPLTDLYMLVTRDQVLDDGTVCPAPEWLASGAVPSVEEAWKMMTINGAYALRMEESVGSLAPGKLADVVVLSDDPQKIPTREILDIEV